ncbi:TPA: hypothetical protein L3996_002480 [Pseudomonas aeruginosa]|uniref:hypothetical protein n=1 Tax=Pseudomonas aeruginosa TaxID=287 RepID=UPI0015728C25|nr:hypothetical protein [Pseudomonas aeruginosa]EKU7417907.1 hypothetical protein [Pseudomonas aeruginosa]MBF2891776.1 hypothetical protein [Pseudomonas aeruginosa]MBF2923818.1 hypothetical protein [Pseudomonas aeruginosa]MBF2938442.1 hypothetical protein [Pseudomonas aeruginosa]MBG5021219.1 hypothetical protein [Pseudomonas aeruginosa]
MSWMYRYALAVAPPAVFFAIWKLGVFAYNHFDCHGSIKGLAPCSAGSFDLLPWLGLSMFWSPAHWHKLAASSYRRRHKYFDCVNTAQAINITTFLQLLSIAGNTKKFSAGFNGAQLTSNNPQQAVSAAGTNSSISVNTVQAANITALLQAIQNAGNNKNFSADFNGAQLTADNLQQALTAAGTKTKISINTAQAVNINTMLQLLSIAGVGKLFSATFNGAQLTANNLQQTANNAGANTTIIVASAQSAPIATLLDVIGTAG